MEFPSTLRLHRDDNILVLTRNVEAGEILRIGDVDCRLDRPLGLGHKVASRHIKCGEKILKYGASIGSAICDIPIGDHVHLHSMKSDYLPTYTLEEGMEFIPVVS